MKITIDGNAEQVRGTLRQILLDVPGAVPDSLVIRGDGTALVAVDIPAEYAEHATVVAARDATTRGA